MYSLDMRIYCILQGNIQWISLGSLFFFFFLKGNSGGEVELILVKEVGKGLGEIEGRETGQDVIYERRKV